MRGGFTGFAAASACAALLVLPGLGAAFSAPGLPVERAVLAQPDQYPPPDTGPYVLQCLPGGMAMWSNGVTGFSEWCLNGNGSPHGPDGYGPLGPVEPGTPGGPAMPGEPQMPDGPIGPERPM